jgi:hypothetical protein
MTNTTQSRAATGLETITLGRLLAHRFPPRMARWTPHPMSQERRELRELGKQLHEACDRLARNVPRQAGSTDQ